METSSHRSADRRTDRVGLWRLTAGLTIGFVLSILRPVCAEIPWPEVVQRLRQENRRLADRPGGHNGEYLLVCTIYYTPMESGFTADRGFDISRVTRPGLRGRTYPRDFLRAVEKEGFGRIIVPVNGHQYIRHNGGNSFAFASKPSGGGGELIARYSAAARPGQTGLKRGAEIETAASTVPEIFGNTRWKIVDTGGGLRRWQVDLYWGEDEPLGPGHLIARPRGTNFEYAYSLAKVKFGSP